MGLLNKVGGIINDITGVSSSAKQQQQAQMGLQKDAQEYSTWQMQNAHQSEVQDLKNAGLNPVLSANGGASAGVVEGGASTGVSGADPIGIITNIINTMNNSARTEAEINKTNAEANLIETEAENTGTKTTALTNAENFANSWWGRNISPLLADFGQIFGGAGAIANASAGISNAKTARMNAKTNEYNAHNKKNNETITHYDKKGNAISQTKKIKH